AVRYLGRPVRAGAPPAEAAGGLAGSRSARRSAGTRPSRPDLLGVPSPSSRLSRTGPVQFAYCSRVLARHAGSGTACCDPVGVGNSHQPSGPLSPNDTYPAHIVTAIIVAHDGAEWLPRVTDAVLGQTHPVQRIV